jgi:hypothetical protein
LPFGISEVYFGPSFTRKLHRSQCASWDIADKFGDTNLLVSNTAQGRDLAQCLGKNSVALMRGHGFASVTVGYRSVECYIPATERACKWRPSIWASTNPCLRGKLPPAQQVTSLTRHRLGVHGDTGQGGQAADTWWVNAQTRKPGLQIVPNRN